MGVEKKQGFVKVAVSRAIIISTYRSFSKALTTDERRWLHCSEKLATFFPLRRSN